MATMRRMFASPARSHTSCAVGARLAAAAADLRPRQARHRPNGALQTSTGPHTIRRSAASQALAPVSPDCGCCPPAACCQRRSAKKTHCQSFVWVRSAEFQNCPVPVSGSGKIHQNCRCIRCRLPSAARRAVSTRSTSSAAGGFSKVWQGNVRFGTGRSSGSQSLTERRGGMGGAAGAALGSVLARVFATVGR